MVATQLPENLPGESQRPSACIQGLVGSVWDCEGMACRNDHKGMGVYGEGTTRITMEASKEVTTREKSMQPATRLSTSTTVA